MGAVRQTWVLARKTLKIILQRHTFATFFRAFLLPVAFMIFLSEARNFLTTPAVWGVGSPTPIRSLQNGMQAATGGRNTLVLVNGGHQGGDIDRVLDNLAAQVPGKTVLRLSNPADISTACKASLRGVTACYGAVQFYSSPTEGGVWNYTLRFDGSLGRSVTIGSTGNDAEIYALPLQRAVDFAIAGISTTVNQAALPTTINEFPYTYETQAQLNKDIRTAYQSLILVALAAAFLLGMVGVVYHLVGFVAAERELGMSQLIEAMMPNKTRWVPQVCRLISYHISFTLTYVIGWLAIGIALAAGVYTNSNKGIVIVFHLLAGLALVSWSIMLAVCFKKAQLSGITAAIITLVLGIIAQVLDTRVHATAIPYVLGLLFAPCNYVLFLVIMSRFEVQEYPTSLISIAPYSWNIPGIVLWVFLIIQIFAYLAIAFFIEKWLHGTASTGRTVVKGNTNPGGPEHSTIELQEFCKYYPPSLGQRWFGRFYKNRPQPVKAVDHLSFTAVKGQILVLLGANGSGKSTTLDAIAGLNTVTGGSIKVDGTGGIGICPQKNVLWKDLTVEEHIQIFNALKVSSKPDSREVRRELIEAVDLDRKISAKAGTLSGGQKRKLQLGMMLTGGSSVVCVDEVTSGLDPLSRRKIWNILMALRGERTVILTTHFLDEADLLSDNIVILSKGTLRAAGSSAALKERLGGGYRINLFTGGKDQIMAPDVPGVPRQTNFDQTTYIAATSTQAAQIVRVLEQEHIEDYQLSEPTIEDVFLALAEEIRAENDETVTRSPSPNSDGAVETTEKAPAARATGLASGHGLQLLPGRRISLGRQAWVLFRKRFTLLQRNWLPYLAAFLLPIVVAGIATTLLKGQTPPGCAPADQTLVKGSTNIANIYYYDVLAGPPAVVPTTNATKYFQYLFRSFPGDGLIPYLPAPPQLQIVTNTSQFENYIGNFYANVTPGGYFAGTTNEVPVIAYQAAATNLFSSMWPLNVLDQTLLNMTIITQFAKFDTPFSPGTGNSLQFVVYMCLVFAAYPAFFALYPTLERNRLVRGLEYSNGVRPLPLWLAYWLFDVIIVIVSSAIATALLSAGSQVWYNLGYVFFILMLYGMCSILLSYVVSLYAGSQLAAFAIVAGTEAVLFLVYLLAYLLVITYAPVQKTDKILLVVNYVISAITPIASLIRALFITLNLFSASCDNQTYYSSPADIRAFGGPIMFLILQILVLFGVLLWYDSKFSIAMFRRSKSTIPQVENATVGVENIEELDRVSTSNDGLRVMHLTKSFGKFTAVEDVTFGIQCGEVFALLGPNGAGKSTTISMIRGDIQPSHNGGDIFVDDIALRKNRQLARTHLGVCPQFDAMDTLTVIEHLRFYARVRGISDVEYNVRSVIQAVGLQAFQFRMASKLSGGNKRKLSLGISLMGNPTVVLLDEPSSGMDAAAKRVMWKTLASVVPGRAILLTTHSMEEAGALANRAGIMAKRMLAMGTTEQLRKQHGDAYHVHLVTKTAPRTTSDEMAVLRAWVERAFLQADIETKTYHGQMRFSVPASQSIKVEPDLLNHNGGDAIHGGSELAPRSPTTTTIGGIGSLITILEDNKERLGLEHYSVSPTTLDNVFLNIVEKHNVEEEGYKPTPAKKGFWSHFSSRK